MAFNTFKMHTIISIWLLRMRKLKYMYIRSFLKMFKNLKEINSSKIHKMTRISCKQWRTLGGAQAPPIYSTK